jgi:glycosyltransferase involved in cell wall biosynthesis
MRIGQNPAKFITDVAMPAPVTVAVTTHIPFLSGYYAQSLNVLRVCLGSILANTNSPYDLLVYDNASCPEVVAYLQTQKTAGNIQYLVLSEKNVGKVGAWNFIFGAAPGEYIAYSDSDVYYLPDWLPRHLAVFKAFPESGTVAGLPRRGRRTFYTSTLETAADLPGVSFEEGKFIPDAWVLDHARSLGKSDTVEDDLGKKDYRITRGAVSAYATATHFQFMVRAVTIRPFLPLAYDRPMGDSVANFDRAINESQLLRLAVTERAVMHLGNTLDDWILDQLPRPLLDAVDLPDRSSPGAAGRSIFHTLLEWSPVKRLLLGLYDRIFRFYYGRKT